MPAPSAPAGDVADRLERLAAQAPASGVDPEQLWARGRRRQRRRWTAVAASVVAIGLLGSSVAPVVAERSREIDPAEPGSSMVLPDVIRQPGSWAPSFADVPGRLSAVGLGQKFSVRHMSSEPAWWGVSAETGESGFLELPGLAAAAGEPALSADGGSLAYWITGPVSGRPLPLNSTTGYAADAVPVVGLAVIDLETGEREVWELDSAHGLFIGGMAWAGDQLSWWAGPIREVNGTLGGEPLPHRWNTRNGERDATVADAGTPIEFAESGTAPGGFLVQNARWRLRWVTATRSATIRLILPARIPADVGILDPVMSPDGSRIAVLLRYGSSSEDVPRAVLVGDVVDGVARLAPVDGAEAQGIVGWRSPTEVVLTDSGDVAEHQPRLANRAWTVDVRSGAKADLLELSGNNPVVAADAWTADVVTASDAPSMPGPAGFGAAAAVLSILLMAGWRTTRRRRGGP